ncbi:MAG: PAS domain-containing protein [Acidimicrobiia bacterium]|nr:PAS domain-containing protein [Acidimicrobiia bacterium]
MSRSEDGVPFDAEELLDSLALGVIALEPVRDHAGTLVDFRWCYANEAAIEILHRPWEVFDGSLLLEVSPEHGPSGLFDRYRAAFETGQDLVSVLEFTSAPVSGFFELHASRVGNHLVVRFVDVTEQAKLEQAEIAARRSTEAVIERISDAVLALDRQWRVTYANAAAHRMLHRGPDTLLGRVVWDEFPHAVGSEFERQYRHAVDTGETVTFDEYYPAPLDTWFRVRAYPDANGLTIYFADVGAERRLEAHLSQLDRLETVSTMAGGIAHDYNNLLMVVAGHASLLAEDLGRAHKGSEDVQAIIEATDRAIGMTRQLLTFSRGQVVRPTTVDLVEQVARLAHEREGSVPDGVEVAAVVDTPPIPAFVDVGELRRMLGHLVDNAVLALEGAGTVLLEVTVADVDQETALNHPGRPAGRYGVVSVSDDGVGMDHEILRRALEPFFTTRRAHGGTGLGLSAAHGIARQAGGVLSLYSEPGVGTTVRVYLPLTDLDGEPVPSGQASDDTDPDDDPGGTETILVVDDNASVRSLIERILRDRGYTVLVAHDTDHAAGLAAIASPPVDLLITDVVMPDRTGHELADVLKLRHPDLEVLYVSGYTENSVITRGVPARDVDFLAKPFLSRELAGRVRAILDRCQPTDP